MKKLELLELAKVAYDKDQLSELDSAIDFASKAHAGQKRRSGEAYVSHPMSVAATLIDWGMDSDSVIAGVLHDVVEDTDVTLDEVENLFGGDVAQLVDGVTKISQVRAGMDDLANYLPQTRDNLSKLLIAVGKDVRVLIIKLADRLHNLKTLQHMPKDKQTKIARESLEVFAPMADRLGMGQVRSEMEELAFRYLDPAQFKRTQNLIRRRIGKSTRTVGIIIEDVKKALKQQNIKGEINGRVKGVYSLYRKLQKVGGDINDVYDLIALRIIVESKEDCYRVLGVLHTLYQPMIQRIKDYVAAPKPNGYQSLHTTVITPSKQIVEFQIRTYDMHEFAERGLAASFHYHDQKNSNDYGKGKAAELPANLQWISQLQDVADRLGSGEDISREQLNIDLFSDRIFLYSPKGDIYNLPEGSLPLDFAYLVHSVFGRHAYSFNVNGKIQAFNEPLHNGDVVEVITRSSVQPKKDWLNHVITTHARTKLRSQLRSDGLIESISHAAAIIRDKAMKKKSKK